jgi:AbrB family looped-hinge helix DNA binding protein
MVIVHMSEKGQITVPKNARKKRGLANGSVLEFIDEVQGDLVFRPLKTGPTLSLIDHLRKFKGVSIPQRKHHGKPRI